MHRYVCSHCLRTFIDEEYSEEYFCWKCGQKLEVIPKEFTSSDECIQNEEFCKHEDNL